MYKNICIGQSFEFISAKRGGSFLIYDKSLDCFQFLIVTDYNGHESNMYKHFHRGNATKSVPVLICECLDGSTKVFEIPFNEIYRKRDNDENDIEGIVVTFGSYKHHEFKLKISTKHDGLNIGLVYTLPYLNIWWKDTLLKFPKQEDCLLQRYFLNTYIKSTNFSNIFDNGIDYFCDTYTRAQQIDVKKVINSLKIEIQQSHTQKIGDDESYYIDRITTCDIPEAINDSFLKEFLKLGKENIYTDSGFTSWQNLVVPGIVDGPIPEDELLNIKTQKEQLYSLARHSYYNFRYWLYAHVVKPIGIELDALYYIQGIDNYLSSFYGLTLYRKYRYQCYSIIPFNDHRFEQLFNIIKDFSEIGENLASAKQRQQQKLIEINQFILNQHRKKNLTLKKEYNDAIKELFKFRKLDSQI